MMNKKSPKAILEHRESLDLFLNQNNFDSNAGDIRGKKSFYH